MEDGDRFHEDKIEHGDCYEEHCDNFAEPGQGLYDAAEEKESEKEKDEYHV